LVVNEIIGMFDMRFNLSMKRKLFGSAERGVGLLYDKEGIKK
jgi:hypothetical protein